MNAALSQGTTDTNENEDTNMGSQSEHTEPVLESEDFEWSDKLVSVKITPF